MSESGEGLRGLRTVRAMVILAGILAFFLGLRVLGRSYSMTRWPVTPGRIVTSAVVPADGKFEARVEYEYILAGRVRRGRLPVSPASRESADSVVARYPIGLEIPVGFDPGDTSQSALRPRVRWWSLALTLAGAGAIGFGLRSRTLQT